MKPSQLDGEAGEIRGCVLCNWISLFFGLAWMIFSVLIYQNYETEALLPALLLGVLGAAWTWMSFISIRSNDTLCWDESGVAGMGDVVNKQQRVFLEWNEITKVKMSAYDSYWSLTAEDGRSVYWSYLHSGHSYFRDLLKTKLNSKIIEE